MTERRTDGQKDGRKEKKKEKQMNVELFHPTALAAIRECL